VTPLERKTLEGVRVLTEQLGVPPSYEEVAAYVGLLSRSGVARMVDSLERQGWLEREPHRARSLRIVGERPRLGRLSSPELRRLRELITEILQERGEA
jgi:SOS-response transcriptional repressor LexA